MTITAVDNAGGSGVNRIEWSVDDGRTWQVYTVPFTYSHEGITHLISRATDNEGNTEFPPATADFKIDYTPPATTCSATGPRDTNGIFRNAITIKCVVTDNASGKDYTEYRFDGGTTWNRLVGTSDSFVIDGNGTTQFLYRSVDMAGNVEGTKDSGPIIINKYVIFSNGTGSTPCSLRITSTTTLNVTGDLYSNGCAELTRNTGGTISGTLTTVSGGNTVSGNTNTNFPLFKPVLLP